MEEKCNALLEIKTFKLLNIFCAAELRINKNDAV